MEERRGSGRVQMRLPVRWEMASGVHVAVILNGSPGGCFVQTQIEEPEDVPLKIEIRLPRGEWISLWGEVAYYLPTEGFGLQFIDSPNDGDPMLEKWLEHLRSLRKDPVSLGRAETTTGAPAVSARLEPARAT